MTNPYEPPQSQAANHEAGPGKHWRPNIWLFALVWPFACICAHAIMLRSLPPALARFGLSPNVFYLLSGLPVLFGYAACIVSAARYPASRSKRMLRGIGALLVMLACGNMWRIVVNIALSGFWR